MVDKHRLTNVDHTTRTAQCSVCGPVSIRSRGTRKSRSRGIRKSRPVSQGWRCSIADDLATRSLEWYEKQGHRGLLVVDDEYDRLFAQQNGCCAICHSSAEGRRLVVDHDHKTGKIRGLLCLGCNVGIGHLRDDVTILESAINYLKADIAVALCV